MNTQMIICMVIFAATLVSYMLNKIPMWLTALISMAALYITGCIDDAGALSGFSNVNTLLMACMFIVAAGFRRTSLVDGMCNSIMKLTHGSFKMAYFGTSFWQFCSPTSFPAPWSFMRSSALCWQHCATRPETAVRSICYPLWSSVWLAAVSSHWQPLSRWLVSSLVSWKPMALLE